MSTFLDTVWTRIASLSELPSNDVVAIQAGDRDIAVYRLDDGVFATDNLCTHGNARLCDGFLLDDEIECPLHQGRFDIRTGKALCAPLTRDLRAYPVKVDGDEVYVNLADAPLPSA
ncbi:non-heme iron oxygenase ferredoxin subunit [Trinickia fusca]|uniref:Non-heme iron oxygenase ferredoxin subunit n=1 Tax=Trinickia fusca TaxID=2419777 RepID=A0A494X058_9BURK|nr:non-heme iron oxygenase ferredoxin subunit [Trinickia fusca]RKP44145.1 non-heme iron oxygenase ferredoxin subunit [Trinickia fusca]